jgi:hypothetical protein
MRVNYLANQSDMFLIVRFQPIQHYKIGKNDVMFLRFERLVRAFFFFFFFFFFLHFVLFDDVYEVKKNRTKKKNTHTQEQRLIDVNRSLLLTLSRSIINLSTLFIQFSVFTYGIDSKIIVMPVRVMITIDKSQEKRTRTMIDMSIKSSNEQ